LDPLGAQATGIITGDVAKLESTEAQLASDAVKFGSDTQQEIAQDLVGERKVIKRISCCKGML